VRFGTQGEELAGQRIQMTFRFPIADPGQPRHQHCWGGDLTKLDQPASLARHDVEIEQAVGGRGLAESVANRKAAKPERRRTNSLPAQAATDLLVLFSVEIAHSEKTNSW
jgi:hypothetical protein